MAERTRQVGPNPEYGRASITNRRLSEQTNQWVYDVTFIDAFARSEKGILSDFLSFVDVDGGVVKKQKRGELESISILRSC